MDMLDKFGKVIDTKKITVKRSQTYNNKTSEEKDNIKNKRANTNLSKYGTVTNLQSKDIIEKRKRLFGANTPFASIEIRNKIAENNKQLHDGCSNSFQWESTKIKIKKTIKKYSF